jgi:nicotinate phosphoribosyltransferase
MRANHPSSLLFTDLYELTMAQAYLKEGFTSTAVFELFFRELPASRNYIIAAGISDILDYLENLHATEDDIAFLRQSGHFLDSFLDYLRKFRFSGDVYAMAEGTPVFPHEPLLQIVAPIIEVCIPAKPPLNSGASRLPVPVKSAAVSPRTFSSAG